MKRLIILTLILVPFALIGLRRERQHPVQVDFAHEKVAIEPQAQLTLDQAALEDGSLLVRGYPMSTPERAASEAREQAGKRIVDWLGRIGLPAGWNLPDNLFEQLAQPLSTEQIERDYGTVYVQTMRLDFSDQSRQQVLRAYETQLSHERLLQVGGLLAFVLACLGVFRSYIRLDEATKGYYTNVLRLGSTLVIAATGAVLIHLLL